MARLWYWRKPRRLLTVTLNALTRWLIRCSYQTARWALQVSPGVSDEERAATLAEFDRQVQPDTGERA